MEYRARGIDWLIESLKASAYDSKVRKVVMHYIAEGFKQGLKYEWERIKSHPIRFLAGTASGAYVSVGRLMFESVDPFPLPLEVLFDSGMALAVGYAYTLIGKEPEEPIVHEFNESKIPEDLITHFEETVGKRAMERSNRTSRARIK